MALLVFLVVVERGHDAGMGAAERLAVPAQPRRRWPASLLVALVVYGVILWLVFGLSLTELKQASYDSIDQRGPHRTARWA